jgi:hypothetical protein
MKDGHIRVVVVVIANGLNFFIISKTKEFFSVQKNLLLKKNIMLNEHLMKV